jgi:short-subunit dehydrogenase
MEKTTLIKSPSMKKILIIGASSGIGKELALAYANAGHTVGITGRRIELLSQIRDIYPQNIEFAAHDISKDDNQKVLETIIQKINGMDIIIISAGIGFINKELNWNREKQTIDTNITGFTEIADFAYNYFAKQKSGQIVGISSIAAIRGIDSCPAYSASKAYIVNYLEALRKKSAKDKANIFVTAVVPGFVDTQMAQGDGLFWVASAGKAARQIMLAIARKKTVVYVTKRWRIIAYLLKILPDTLYNRL